MARFARVYLMLLVALASIMAACSTGASVPVTSAPTVTSIPTVTASPAFVPDPTMPAATATATPTVPSPATTGASAPNDGGPAPVDTFAIVNAFPHDPQAFTQGLLVDNGEWFESTGLQGKSTLRRVKPETGEVLQRAALPGEDFGEGLAALDGKLYQLTWRTQRLYIYDRVTFELLETRSYATEGWGLTTDGELLVMSDGSDRITFRDPTTFAIQRSIDVMEQGEPITMLNELEWINGEIWANVWMTDRIVRINPKTGSVLGWIDLTGLLRPEDRGSEPIDVLNGIAYDKSTGKIYVTGKRWPVIYEIRIVPGAQTP